MIRPLGAQFDHGAIAEMLADKHGVPGWWSQMVTVEYERARGMRVRHETASGFSVGVSKTIATSLSKLYAATANVVKRKKWFPTGAFEASSQTKDKYLNGSWNNGARLNIGAAWLGFPPFSVGASSLRPRDLWREEPRKRFSLSAQRTQSRKEISVSRCELGDLCERNWEALPP